MKITKKSETKEKKKCIHRLQPSTIHIGGGLTVIDYFYCLDCKKQFNRLEAHRVEDSIPATQYKKRLKNWRRNENSNSYVDSNRP